LPLERMNKHQDVDNTTESSTLRDSLVVVQDKS